MVTTRAMKRSASTIQGDPDITLRNCSAIIKAAIKFIEPQKHVKHPYSRKGASIPDWWPLHITHKHPEHMRKEDRIELFIHILYNLGRTGLTADDLERIATDSKQDLRDPEDVNIIYEVFRVRKMEEQFERGEIGANTVIHLEGFRAEGYKECGSANAASAVIQVPRRRDQGLEHDLALASDYAHSESPSTLLKIEDVDTSVTFIPQA
ncbi:unnamed protein product [Penicillium viridicatum]